MVPAALAAQLGGGEEQKHHASKGYVLFFEGKQLKLTPGFATFVDALSVFPWASKQHPIEEKHL